MSAAKGFVGGVFVTAPVTAFMMYIVLGQQAAVDARLDRHEVRQEIARVERDAAFDAAWEGMTGQKIAACAPDRAATLAELRGKLSDLNARLASSTVASDADRAALEEAMRALAPAAPGQ